MILGLIFTALAQWLFVASLRQIRAQTASVVTCLEPVYGILFAVLLLGEKPSARTLLGGLLIFGAVLGATLAHIRRTRLRAASSWNDPLSPFARAQRPVQNMLRVPSLDPNFRRADRACPRSGASFILSPMRKRLLAMAILAVLPPLLWLTREDGATSERMRAILHDGVRGRMDPAHQRAAGGGASGGDGSSQGVCCKNNSPSSTEVVPGETAGVSP